MAPTVLPKGFVDAKEASFKVVKEIALDENDYRFGHTKVQSARPNNAAISSHPSTPISPKSPPKYLNPMNLTP